MESSMAMHMPATSFDPFARDLSTLDDTLPTTSAELADVALQASYMESPAQQIVHEHLRSSNLRGAEDLSVNGDALLDMPASPIAGAANLPALARTVPNIMNGQMDAIGRYMNGSSRENDPISAVSELSLNLEEMKGYAQLVFPDGEYLVTSTEIMLGRDERAQQILKEQEKRQRRLLREQVMRQAQEQAALAALESYKMEPGTASDDARRGSSSSSHMLEGRPAPGLPSTFSETGGIVNYEGSIDGLRKRHKRRSLLLSRSSSTNSVAPASLHVYGAAATPWGSNDDEKCIFLPIHPFQVEDIRKISKEHLRIFYDPTEKHWKMEIKGNGAFVLNELYKETIVDPDTGEEDITPRHFKRGDTVILTHNSEVLVTSLTFLFKLPYKRGLSTFESDDDGDALDTSPTQRTGDLEEDAEEGSESSDNDHVKQENDNESPVKRPKIMLKVSKPRLPVEPDSPEPPRPTGGKGKKKPGESAKPAEPEQVAQLEPSPSAATASAQMQPPVFDANSTLQHVPVNELPEKRKGPGRPPKNGLVSKRDEGIIRRKMKEYEKRGERPPPYKEILAMVRAENRAKELAARAAARGEPMPATPFEMMNAVPTTESDGLNENNDIMNADATQLSPVNVHPAGSQDHERVEMLKTTQQQQQLQQQQHQQQQQQQRTYKSPSPMKPREEYTEEQLKRPTQTYYYILDEILTEGPEDAMELQQIYDKICKKYPFYKYVIESNGWQSSVRHNLKQNDRFKPVSKQGKGWLWAIDPAVPLDKEKKKKPTPPPMPRPPMQYNGQDGAMQPGTQYNAAYPTQYAQPYANGQTQYPTGVQQQQQPQPYSMPYSGATQHYPQATAPGSQPPPPVSASTVPTVQPHQPAVPRTLSHPPSRPASNTPQPAAQSGALPPAFQDLVEEIMRFRVEYLSPFGNDKPAYEQHERIFKRCVEWISQLHMRQNPEVKFENDEERRVFQILERMRNKFEQGASKPQPKPVQQHAPAVPAALPAPQQPGHPDEAASHGSFVPQPQQQPAMPQNTALPGFQPSQTGHVTATQPASSTSTETSGLPTSQLSALPQAAVAVSAVPAAATNPMAQPASLQAGPPSTITGQADAQVTAEPPSQVIADSRTPVVAAATPSVLADAAVLPSTQQQPLITGVKRAADNDTTDGEHDEKRVRTDG